MDFAQECFRMMYEPVGRLDEQGKLTLVKSQIDQRLYVEKILAPDSMSVIMLVKNNPHPNLVGIHDCYEANGKLTVIEEFINGRDLSRVLEDEGLFSVERTCRTVAELCLALHHLHCLNPPVIHRDVKPSNVMLDGQGVVKLVDLNISRLYKEELSQDTRILGTAGFAAPEQFGFAQTDSRSDLYSAGILINYLLTGRYPNEEMHQGPLNPVILRCIHIDPAKRYANTMALWQDLTNCLQWLEAEKKKAAPAPKKGRFSLPIPGFRTGRVWKALLAAFGYWAIFSFVSGFESFTNSAAANTADKAMLFVLLIWLVILYTDYLGLRRFFPMFESPKKLVRFGACVAYTFLGFSMFLFVSAIISLIL